MDLLTPGIGLIFWQALTFLVVLILLGKFAWPSIIGALKAREISIEEALRAADNAKNEMQLLQAANEKLLAEARLERDKIIKEATNAANKIKDEIKADADIQASKILKDAKAEIENQKNAAMTEVKSLVASLSIGIAEKVLKKELSNKADQESLIKGYIKEIKLN
jgi:F-type H+-transporting ATPase subunit b